MLDTHASLIIILNNTKPYGETAGEQLLICGFLEIKI